MIKFRGGSWVYIAASHSKYCPVHLVRKFLTVGNHQRNDYLFHGVTVTNSGYKLRVRRLSYSRALELMRGQLQAIGLDPKKYGLHSMRSGGASLAAALGVPDRLIMRHRGWRSELSKNRYINESLGFLLEISRTLKR